MYCASYYVCYAGRVVIDERRCYSETIWFQSSLSRSFCGPEKERNKHWSRSWSEEYLAEVLCRMVTKLVCKNFAGFLCRNCANLAFLKWLPAYDGINMDFNKFSRISENKLVSLACCWLGCNSDLKKKGCSEVGGGSCQ